MSIRIVKAYCTSALILAAATSVASASTYYQTTDFQSSNISSSNAATTDFVSDLQLGTAPTDHANTPIVNSNSVTLEGESNQSAVMGLIDSGASNNGVYGDTDAVLDFTPVNVGNVAYTTFGLGERLTGGGPLTSKSNNYPSYLVYFDLGTLELTEEQGYTSGYGASMASQSGITLSGTDSYQLEMTTIGSDSPVVTVVLTDETTDSVVADITATGDLTDTEGAVGFYGGSDGNGDYNVEHGINATTFSVNAVVATPEPTAVGLVTLVGSGLMLKRRRRAI